MTYISSQSIYRVESDKFYDKIPIVATMNNIVDFAQKVLYRDQSVASKDHYYHYITEKSILRCLCLCVPVFGQIGVYLYDRYVENKIHTLLRSGKLVEAAKLGSGYALAVLASNYEIGNGVLQNNKLSFELYKQAAEKGNVLGFLNLVYEKEESEYLKAFHGNREGLRQLIKEQSGCKTDESLIKETHFWVMDFFSTLVKLDEKDVQRIASHIKAYKKIIRIIDITLAEDPCFSPYERSIKDIKNQVEEKILTSKL